MAIDALFQTSYDRSECKIGVVHLGYGAFHRAHQAVYIDDVMEKTGDLNWGIAAVNLRAKESVAFAEAKQADEGYLLKTTSPEDEQAWRLVRSHIAFVDWAEDSGTAEALLTLPTVHAVTITVTESGYSLNDDASLNLDDNVIADEVNGAAPQSVYGYLARALEMRAQQLDQPLTILCCDNIRNNGLMLSRNLEAYLEATGKSELLEWVSMNVDFPCSMVDRITPRATDALSDEVAKAHPGKNLAPIHAEAFKQWVIEDAFAGPMPDLKSAGVQIVDDVDPYEETKIRILNGGHLGLTYLGALSGHKTFDEAMADPELMAFFYRWQRENVLPGLEGDLPIDKTEYLKSVASRFCNPAIADTLERICMDGYSKMAIYIRPTLNACLEQNIRPLAGYDCVASWVVYARRFEAGKMPITYTEPFWDRLQPMIQPGAEDMIARDSRLWHDLPDRFPTFAKDLGDAIRRMDKRWGRT